MVFKKICTSMYIDSRSYFFCIFLYTDCSFLTISLQTTVLRRLERNLHETVCRQMQINLNYIRLCAASVVRIRGDLNRRTHRQGLPYFMGAVIICIYFVIYTTGASSLKYVYNHYTTLIYLQRYVSNCCYLNFHSDCIKKLNLTEYSTICVIP